MSESEELDHQQMAIELCDGFTPLDQVALAALEPDGLVAQYEANQVETPAPTVPSPNPWVALANPPRPGADSSGGYSELLVPSP